MPRKEWEALEEDTVDRPATENSFWKPYSAETLVGKLERIAENKNGEYGVFEKPVLLNFEDGRPYAAPDVLLVSFTAATLRGIFDGTSQGAFFRITFTGWEQSEGGGNKFRAFTVGRLRNVADAAAKIAAWRGKVAAEIAGALDDALPDDTEMPF